MSKRTEKLKNLLHSYSDTNHPKWRTITEMCSAYRDSTFHRDGIINLLIDMDDRIEYLEKELKKCIKNQ